MKKIYSTPTLRVKNISVKSTLMTISNGGSVNSGTTEIKEEKIWFEETSGSDQFFWK